MRATFDKLIESFMPSTSLLTKYALQIIELIPKTNTPRNLEFIFKMILTFLEQNEDPNIEKDFM